MLRAPSRSPLAQLIARVLVVALVAAAVPTDATASLSAGKAPKLTKSAFGELLAHTGTDPQPYAFTGEPYDPNVGFQYHRARWMDPRVGRFVGMDPWEGRTFDPSSLHKYLYAGANPTHMVDPSGLEGYAGSLVAIGVRTVVGAIAQIGLDIALNAVADTFFPNNEYVKAGIFVVQTATTVANVARLGWSPIKSNFSLSVVLNIAEAGGRHSRREKARFYTIARGSSTEVAALFDVLERRRLAPFSAIRGGRRLAIRVVQMLTRMDQRLRS